MEANLVPRMWVLETRPLERALAPCTQGSSRAMVPWQPSQAPTLMNGPMQTQHIRYKGSGMCHLPTWFRA